MSAESETVVEIPQGKLRGRKDVSAFGTEFYSFYRIPYAKPPVGELRFKAPQPAEGWTDILDATQEGTLCPCPDWPKLSCLKGSREDSLFINVYCKQNPNAPGKKRPVMVSIHGGGFEVGTGNRNMSGPDFFMLHDVIMVTFNYRLGVLGFLSLQTVECPGNFGLKDQQLALKWVKNNIAHFGGDPDNITVFGISAGAASAHYQTLSPSNEGLFKRVILQSGAAMNRWAISRRPRENAFALGRRLGCDTKDDRVLLDFLRKTPADDLVVKGWGIIDETEGQALGERFLKFSFVPVVEPQHEEAFIIEHPWLLAKAGRCLDVPMIAGITSKEMILGVKGVDDYPRFSDVEEFQQLIPRDVQLPKNGQKSLAVAKLIKEFYFKDGVTLDSYIDILSDNFFNYGVFKTVEGRIANKNIKSPSYLYQFIYEGDQTFLKNFLSLNDVKGACHGDDTGYTLKTEFSDLEKMQPGSRDYKFMMNLTKLWVSFATTGNPVLEEPGFVWKETTGEDYEYLELGEKFIMKKGFLRDRMKLWDEIYTSFYEQ